LTEEDQLSLENALFMGLIQDEVRDALLVDDVKSVMALLNVFFGLPHDASEIPQGFVYVVLAVGIGRYKIGFSISDPRFRVKALQIGSPIKLELVAVIPKCSRDDELALHHRFEASRLHGEWFSGTSDLLAFIEAHRSLVDESLLSIVP